MIPPLTVYAIDVNDSKIWFSVNTPYFGNEPRPGMQTAAPGQKPDYTLTVAPGAYYMLAYFEKSYFDALPSGSVDKPGIYSRYTIDCNPGDPTERVSTAPVQRERPQARTGDGPHRRDGQRHRHQGLVLHPGELPGPSELIGSSKNTDR